ncbi:hypothetical protein K437DRAFT_36142 [Tilletiaria anomala UBC 951]|uniref:Uncharacterized protein n=1 Tax=Tilletiaria anomala (strain ATCC 24038 / CBS 436.72 / UBC 951) TaxID=1037660 RepID=A0A066VGG4_TILAU|nr:uncharacterized protein K437DRAFT_36142 [Tilletiaria anomala UBC 951]KDN37685.1 hypothetical protein K437DRAFT_36142 [Tilletiaria anomala UBC 951]
MSATSFMMTIKDKRVSAPQPRVGRISIQSPLLALPQAVPTIVDNEDSAHTLASYTKFKKEAVVLSSSESMEPTETVLRIRASSDNLQSLLAASDVDVASVKDALLQMEHLVLRAPKMIVKESKKLRDIDHIALLTAGQALWNASLSLPMTIQELRALGTARKCSSDFDYLSFVLRWFRSR